MKHSPLQESIGHITDIALTNSANSIVKNTLNAALVPLNDKITQTVRQSMKTSPLRSFLIVLSALGSGLALGKVAAEWLAKKDPELARYLILGGAGIGGLGGYFFLESSNAEESNEYKVLPQQAGLSDTALIPTIAANQIAYFHVPTIQISGEWAEFLGQELSYHATMLVYGNSGNGKTTFGFKMAQYLQRMGKILFILTEYGLQHRSLQQLTQEFGLNENVVFGYARSMTDVWKLVQQEHPTMIIIDSLSQIGGDAQQLHQLAQVVYLTVAMLHVTKEGNFAGNNQLSHDADIIVHVENLEAKTIKNRFHQTGMIMPVRGTQVLKPVIIEEHKERSGLY
jgi:hypothetical protein